MPQLRIPPGFADPVKLQQRLHTEPEENWIRRGEQRALRLFHDMAQNVPAYRDFLNKNKLDHHKIKSISDFQFVPPVDKDNYLRVYPRAMLCWGGKFDESSWVISGTSGSTGNPYYFPRLNMQDRYYAIAAELYLRENFDIHKKTTLYIDAFAMGVWIGGLFTYEAVRTIAESGRYSLSIITPGINKLEVVKAVENLGKDFDQIIIGSYPPILKDILDDGTRQGLNWKDYNIGFVFSAEGFTETFRDYVLKTCGIEDVYKSTLNHYGTVDLGTMSHETPISILARRQALQDEKLFESIFSQVTKLPTLTQFIPELFYFEEDNGKLLCSSYSGIPLVRYDLKDHGGVFTLHELKSQFRRQGIEFDQLIADAGLGDTVWNLPFVHVFERSDFSVKFLGFQVYPEPIRKALHEPKFHTVATGKFTITVEYDEKQEQQLYVHVELKSDIKPTEKLKAEVTEEIIAWLVKENSIYKMNRTELGDRVEPQVVFWPYEHSTHFSVGGKQKWVKK